MVLPRTVPVNGLMLRSGPGTVCLRTRDWVGLLMLDLSQFVFGGQAEEWTRNAMERQAAER